MLTVVDYIPEGFLQVDAHQLYEVLPGPTLIHLPGRRSAPLFVSVLLHGNETTGFHAVQALLKGYQNQELPRSMSIFVGNVEAARQGLRRLDNQPDYNRVWPGTPAAASAERDMMSEVFEDMRNRKVFASIDIHNNTGLNPHYACVNRIDHRFFHLATLFSRTVVYFTRPAGVQSIAFAQLCPSVTVECGQAGQRYSVDHALAFLDGCIHLAELPNHPVARHDLDLFHTVAIVRVPESVEFAFTPESADLVFDADIDHMNFRELAPGTCLGRCRDGLDPPLDVVDNEGEQSFKRFFSVENGSIVTTRPVMPSMLTLDARVIRQDCLCYLMERYRLQN